MYILDKLMTVGIVLDYKNHSVKTLYEFSLMANSLGYGLFSASSLKKLIKNVLSSIQIIRSQVHLHYIHFCSILDYIIMEPDCSLKLISKDCFQTL